MSKTTQTTRRIRTRITKVLATPPPVARNPMEKLLSRVTPANPCFRTDQILTLDNGAKILAKDIVVAATAAIGGQYAPAGASLRFWSCLNDTARNMGLRSMDTKSGHKAVFLPGHAPEDADYAGLNARMAARASKLLELI